MTQTPPLVAIHCLVYNHEPYLRDCFEEWYNVIKKKLDNCLIL